MEQRKLTIDALAALVRTQSVSRIQIYRAPGGGWRVYAAHADRGTEPTLSTRRGEIRTFRTLDAVVSEIQDCGFDGAISVDPAHTKS